MSLAALAGRPDLISVTSFVHTFLVAAKCQYTEPDWTEWYRYSTRSSNQTEVNLTWRNSLVMCSWTLSQLLELHRCQSQAAAKDLYAMSLIESPFYCILTCFDSLSDRMDMLICQKIFISFMCHSLFSASVSVYDFQTHSNISRSVNDQFLEHRMCFCLSVN